MDQVPPYVLAVLAILATACAFPAWASHLGDEPGIRVEERVKCFAGANSQQRVVELVTVRNSELGPAPGYLLHTYIRINNGAPVSAQGVLTALSALSGFKLDAASIQASVATYSGESAIEARYALTNQEPTSSLFQISQSLYVPLGLFTPAPLGGFGGGFGGGLSGLLGMGFGGGITGGGISGADFNGNPAQPNSPNSANVGSENAPGTVHSANPYPPMGSWVPAAPYDAGAASNPPPPDAPKAPPRLGDRVGPRYGEHIGKPGVTTFQAEFDPQMQMSVLTYREGSDSQKQVRRAGGAQPTDLTYSTLRGYDDKVRRVVTCCAQNMPRHCLQPPTPKSPPAAATTTRSKGDLAPAPNEAGGAIFNPFAGARPAK